jgi:hypothetical protein
MSDNWIQFVPSDARYRPSAEAAARARALLASFVPEADEVSATFMDAISFFDPGGNWSGVRCPVCGADAEPWWSEAMDRAHARGFSDLRMIAPCCRTTVSLNELDYVWPAAFGCFVVEARNPNVRDLKAKQKQQLEDCLGCRLKRIWVHL